MGLLEKPTARQVLAEAEAEEAAQMEMDQFPPNTQRHRKMLIQALYPFGQVLR